MTAAEKLARMHADGVIDEVTYTAATIPTGGSHTVTGYGGTPEGSAENLLDTLAAKGIRPRDAAEVIAAAFADGKLDMLRRPDGETSRWDAWRGFNSWNGATADELLDKLHAAGVIE